MPMLSPEVQRIELPKMFPVRQKFDSRQLENVKGTLAEKLKQTVPVPPGASVAVAVGSRGIRDLLVIVKETVRHVKEAGGMPFIVAAMGSHGGGTEEGKRSILGSYGITEENLGVPVDCSLDTVELGRVMGDVPVHVSVSARNADMVIAVNRIKPHTDYRGDVESGLCKMLAVGLGKHTGCSLLHTRGFEAFGDLIPAAADLTIGNLKACFGVGIIENAYDRTRDVEVLHAREFLSREPELLKTAREHMPKIMLTNCDILVVEQIGKDISGAGMDPNVVGRTTKGIIEGYSGPDISRVIVKQLTPASHGNALGIGLADFTLESLVKDLDLPVMCANAVASGNPESARIPPAFGDIASAVKAAAACSPKAEMKHLRIIQIKNTLELEHIWVSEALLPEVEAHEKLERTSGQGRRIEEIQHEEG